MSESGYEQPCGCWPLLGRFCMAHFNEMADSVNSPAHRASGTACIPQAEPDTGSAFVRRDRITSAIAGIANAIELCSDAGLESITDRLLALQVEALRERERA
jgi:hypothetical protein